MSDDDDLLGRAEQALTEIKVNQGLSEEHEAGLAALRIRLTGTTGSSFPEEVLAPATDDRPAISPMAHMGSNDDAPAGEMLSHNEEHLAEHETQVASRTQLTVKLTKLETQLPAPALAHFHKLLANRSGKAVAAIENGTCSGCRTRLRGPYIPQVREAKQPIPCENCQRWVYMPDAAVQVAAAK